MKAPAVCTHCNLSFPRRSPSQGNLFCSRKCANIVHNSQRDRRIVAVCPVCQQTFKIHPSQLRRFCSNSCKNTWQRTGLKGPKNPNWKGGPEERVCLNCHTQFLAPRTQLLLGLGKFCSSRCAGQFKPEHIRRKIGEMTREHFKDPVVRQRHREGLIRSGVWERGRKRFSELRHDPAFIKAQLRGLNTKPNRPETLLKRLLHKHMPGQWAYTGDGAVILGGLVPDFTNINGLKAVIEVFGEYWHSPRKTKHNRPLAWHQTEPGRVSVYNSLGFQCLIIWVRELEDQKAVVEKITTFTERAK